MVIVIGATGFIGMYTTEALIKSGRKVIACGRNDRLGEVLENMGATFFKLDITEKDGFDKLPTEDIEALILLAGLLPANATADLDNEENARDYFEVNVIGAINVLEYCRRNGIKKVLGNCTFSDVSNAWRNGYAITESESISFSHIGDHAVYVISHTARNDVMQYYNEQHDMKCAWFRLPPVYGVGPHGTIYVNGKPYKSGIATWIDAAVEGGNIEIWGDKDISRDIVYVKDVARAYILALESDNALGLYNISSGVGVTLQEQAETVVDVFGDGDYDHIIYCPNKTNNSPSFLFSIDKARKDFGYYPEYADYKTMMIDYKEELESGRWDLLTQLRRKD